MAYLPAIASGSRWVRRRRNGRRRGQGRFGWKRRGRFEGWFRWRRNGRWIALVPLLTMRRRAPQSGARCFFPRAFRYTSLSCARVAHGSSSHRTCCRPSGGNRYFHLAIRADTSLHGLREADRNSLDQRDSDDRRSAGCFQSHSRYLLSARPRLNRPHRTASPRNLFHRRDSCCDLRRDRGSSHAESAAHRR